MRPSFRFTSRFLSTGISFLACTSALAGPVYMPPSANLVYGDVTHGQRVLSASGNPAAAAVDVVRGGGKSASGTVISGGAGLEYGNVQDIFDTIDEVARYFTPSKPGSGPTPPGQKPDEKPPGIDTGTDWREIIDAIDPELGPIIEAFAVDIAVIGGVLAVVAVEGYGKLFVQADAPFVIGREFLGGTWSFGVNWSGESKAFGLVAPIEFDVDTALNALEGAVNLKRSDPVTIFNLTPDGDILARIDPATGSTRIAVDNDSSLVTKASTTTELNLGYSSQVWPTRAGSLYLGAKARFYMMRLSRATVRFGDITDSDELFDAIRNADYKDDNGAGLDFGALWVADNYQVGAQVTNINEPEFEFPGLNLEAYKEPEVIAALTADQNYTMERQFRFEGSVFTQNRRWTMNLGIDANAAPDPMGDDYQWLTASVGYATDSWWLPGVRAGLRKNLAGTEIGYVGIGLTALKVVNIDIASALETVSISGTDLPRGLMASIGFQIAW